MLNRTPLNLLASFALSLLALTGAFAQAGNASNTATDPRHETLNQRVVSVFFDQNILSATTAGWKVTVNGTDAILVGTTFGVANGITVSGGVRVLITFDASPSHAGEPYIKPGDVVLVSYDQATGNTLTNTAGSPEINSFTGFQSKNNWSPTCASDVEYQSEGLAPGAGQDQCSPVNTNYYRWTYAYSLRFRNSSSWNTFSNYLNILWGYAGDNTIARGYLSDGAGNPNTSFIITSFQSAFPGILLTFRPGFNTLTLINDGVTNPYSYPDNTNICNFRATVAPVNSIFDCVNTASLRKSTQFDSFDFDDQNTGQLLLPPTIVATDRVCLGNNVGMTFTNSTDLNCNGAGDLDVPPNASGNPANSATRWVRFIYGALGAAPVGYIPDIRVGGVQVTNSTTGVLLAPYNANPIIGGAPGYVLTGAGGPGIPGVPDANGVIELAGPVSEPLNQVTEIISTLSAANHAVQQRFYVTLQFWGPCNRYDVGDPPVSITTSYVEIIDKPVALTTTGQAICFTTPNSTAFNFTAVSSIGGLRTAVNWYKDRASVGTATKMINPNGTNSLSFPAGSYGTEGGIGGAFTINNANGRYHSVWVTQVAGASNNCESDPVEVVIIQQPRIDIAPDIPSTPAGNAVVCNGPPDVLEVYTTSAPNTKTIPITTSTNGAAINLPTENFWSLNNFGVATVSLSPTTGNSTTVTYNISPQPNPSDNGDVRVRRRYVTTTNIPVVSPLPAPYTLPTYNINPLACQNANVTLTVDVFGQSDGGTTSPSMTICNGSSTGNMTVTGTRGAILQWERQLGAGAFVAIAGTAGLATISDIPPSGPGIYHYRVVVQNQNATGPCPVATTIVANQNSVTVNTIPPKPTITPSGATTFCFGGSVTLTSSNTSAATYRWYKDGIFTGIVTQNIVLSTVAQSGSYTVETIGIAPSNCVSPLSDPTVVTVNALPTANVSGGGSVCAGNPAPDVVFTFTGTGPWDLVYSINGVNQPVQNNVTSPFNITTPGIGTYLIVSVTDNNTPTCAVTAPSANITGTAAVAISATPPPTVDGFTVTAPVCHDGGATNPPDAILDLAPNVVVNYDFTYVINGNIHVMNNVASNASGQITIAPPYTDWGSVPGSYVVTITALKNTLTGCAGAVPFDSPLLIVNSRPAAPTGAVPGVVCSTSLTGAAISVNAPAVGFTILWSSTSAPTFTAAVGVTGGTRGNTFTPTSNSSATYFAFTQDDLAPTNCLSATSLPVTHTQDLIPTLTSAGPDQPSLCTGSALMAAQTPNNGGAGLWTIVGGPIPGLVITAPTSPTTTVTGIPQDVPGGAPIITTLRWTVTSALLTCSIPPDDVILTVNPLPTSIDPAPHLCDEVSGAPVRVTNVNLAAYNASVTNAAAVSWFSNAARTIPVAGNIAPIVDNGANKTFYFIATGSCSNIGQLTFTIDALPSATDRNVQVCEDAPPGSNAATGINLQGFENSITGGVVTSDVEWYEDAGLTILIPPGVAVGAEQNYSVTADKTIFAKVINSVSTVIPKCFDVANLTIDYQARPSDNQIKDAGNVIVVDGLAGTYSSSYTVCASNALVLLQIDPSRNPSATYSWNVPAPSYTIPANFFGPGNPASPTPEFEILTSTNGFFVILRFNFSTSPAPVPFVTLYGGGIPITVTETLGTSCTSNPLTVNVNVEASPPQPIIAGPSTVCSGGVANYSITNPLAGKYSWTLPPGATITSLPITASTITVQMSTFSGNVNATHSSGSSCTSPPAAAYPVTIVAKPSFTATVSPLCSGQSVNTVVNLNPSIIGTTYNWEIRPGGISGLIGGANVGDLQNGQTNIGSPFPQVLTNTSGLVGSVTYRVTPVGPAPDNCIGTAQDITIIVNPAPIVAPLQTKAICSGDAANYKILLSPVGLPANTIFTWLTPPVMSDLSTQGTNNLGGLPQSNGIHISDVLVNTTGSPITATYSIIATDGSCSSPPVDVVITVNPAPVIQPGQSKIICSGDAVDFKILLIPPGLPATTKFSWPVPSLSGGPAQGTASIAGGVLQSDALHLTDVLVNNTGSVITATYNVTATNGLCALPPVPVIITINPSPTANNINQIVCSDLAGGTTALTNLSLLEPAVNSGGGVTFSWFEDLALTIPIATPGSFTLTNGDPVFVEVDNGQCQKISTVTYTINPLPSISTIATQITCNGAANGQINATATPVTGTGPYTFSINAGVTYFPSGTFNALSPGSYTIRVKDAKGCEVNSALVPITQPFPVVASQGTVVDATCKGSATGSIQAVASGGLGLVVGDYLYSINGGAFQASDLFTGLTAGVYTISVKDTNGCTDSEFVTVNEPALLTASISGQTNVDCKGNNTGSVTIAAAGGTSVIGYQYSLDGITFQASSTFNGLIAGNYLIRVRDDNSCQTNVGVNITEPTLLTVTVSAITNVDCNGNNTGSLTVTGTGGTGAYSFSLVPVGNPPGVFAAPNTFGSLASGTYTIYIRDINLCQKQVDAIVTQPNTLALALISKVNVLCNGQSTGSIAVQASDGTGPYEYSINGGPFTPNNNFTFLPAGPYSINVKDLKGCPANYADVITQPTAINGSLTSISPVTCFGKADAQIQVNPGGGTAPYQYLLVQDPSNAPAGTLFSNIRQGSYTVLIRDNNNCSFITPSLPVTEPAKLTISADVTSNYNGFDVSCLGASDGQISVITSGGGTVPYQFQINGGALQASTNFPGLVANTAYTVAIVDNNNCTVSALPVVLFDPLPLFEGVVGLDKSVCVGSDPTAFTELAAAFGGIGNYAYQWLQSTDGIAYSNVLGATNKTFDPPVLPQTTFFKRRITSGTCSTLETLPVKVTVNPLPTATLVPGTSPVCENGTFLLNFTFTGQAPFYFDYNDGTTFVNDRLGAANTPIPVFNYLNTTTFSITELRDFNGCVATSLPAPVTVPVIKVNPAFTIVSSPAQCSGGMFDFQFTVDPNVDYLWIWGDGQTTPVPKNTLATGPGPISHRYRSFNTSSTTSFPVVLTAVVAGCPAKQSNQSIDVYPNILVNLFPDKTEICSGDQVTFSNPTAGGTTHHWFYRELGVVEKRDERTFVAASDQTFTFNNTTIQNPIIYELVYEVNNANCAADTAIEITVYREVVANFSHPPLIPQFIGGNANMSFTNTSVPVNGTEFEYDWDFGNGAIQIPVSGVGPFNFNYITPGTKTVRLLATNLVAQANGLTCTSVHQETFNILLPPLVAAFEFTPLATCFPASIQITRNLATGNTFEWRLVDGTGRQLLVTNDTLPTFTLSSAGRYTIFLSTKNTLTGQTATADNSGLSHNILAGNPTLAEDFNIPIEIYPQPFAAFEARPTVIYVPDTRLQVFNLSSSATDPLTATPYPIEYRWYFGDGSDTLSTADSPDNFEPSHFYINEGPYDIALLAMNDHGNGAVCIDTAIQRISAKAAGFTRIPNAFTPSTNGTTNGAGSGGNSVNDVFLPIAKGVVDFQMQIFDRWGNLIFETKDKTIGWDGYDKHGVLLPAGVYVYKLVMRLSNDQRTTQIGDVTLIR